MGKKIVCTGGSITAGHGWDQSLQAHRDSMWVNHLTKKIKKFEGMETVNLGVNGNSNEMIFYDSVNAISKYGQNIECLLCSWVQGPRYHYELGFELYDTHDCHVEREQDLGINGMVIPKKYINNIKQRFFSLHHLHYEIIKVLKYSNALIRLGNMLSIPVYHINDSCLWDQGYFDKRSGRPSDYTKFTQNEILNVDNRSDEEIYQLYNKLHLEYATLGKPTHDYWINLYNSFFSLMIDNNQDRGHPGYQSNEIYSDMIKKFFNHIDIF